MMKNFANIFVHWDIPIYLKYAYWSNLFLSQNTAKKLTTKLVNHMKKLQTRNANRFKIFLQNKRSFLL
jgi:hypothetical protein